MTARKQGNQKANKQCSKHKKASTQESKTARKEVSNRESKKAWKE